jgi:succinyl-CoA synthetase beta subunit
MKLHEYQAKELLRKRGVLTLDSQVCFTLDEVKQAIKDIGCPCVIKAQVHAGGRGKAGGIKLAHNEKEALAFAQDILAMTIKTAQTGAQGQKVACVLLEKAAKIKRELYVSMLIDRESSKICLVAAAEGGTEIEELAETNPKAIKKIEIDKSIGLMPYQIRNLAHDLNIENDLRKNFVSLLSSIYRAFVECDASLIEINPLAITEDRRLIVLDAKMIIDDNALFRQRSLSEMRDPSQEDEKEVEAQHHGLSYVALDGNIACMVNGAGLAMATMDVIKHVGGSPANFLDVGGSATKERVETALRIIARDKNVKAVFINVFGGIVKCDVIAEGVVKAVHALNLQLPLVVRLEGTNVDLGKHILEKSGLSIIAVSDLLEGAQKAVAAVR